MIASASEPSQPGRVVFLGAGPGDPELLTVKAARLIGQADLVLYAGSLVSPGVVALARAEARVIDSSGLTLGRDPRPARGDGPRPGGWPLGSTPATRRSTAPWPNRRGFWPKPG